MAKEGKKSIGIIASKNEAFTDWYPEVVQKADLADYSPVKGAMVIKANGYAIWQKIQEYFNPVIKKHGVSNYYFPMFIPESFFTKEAEHAEGFTPEVAWIANSSDEERLAVRPTSETIIADSFSKWVHSWRDLPIRTNQWANVVRWETKQTRLFLRTREFLWQEGHCIYETEEECEKEVRLFMDEYVKMVQELLAIPVIPGRKTTKEKFAGAEYTLTMEGLMPDGRSLQMGTSHHLGQGFMKAFDVSFVGKDEKPQIPHYNSWGVSTRLIGALIMTHGDDKGMVMPPNVAPVHAVIVPILFDKTREETLEACEHLKYDLIEHGIDTVLDDRDGYSPGWKFNEWELKGVPVRIEVGPKDLEKNQVTLVRRDTGEKSTAQKQVARDAVKSLLEDIQDDMFEKAKKIRDAKLASASTMEELASLIAERKMVLVPFCDEPACEDYIKEKSGGASSSGSPLDSKVEEGAKCIHCEKDAKMMVYFAKSY
jgi:prolyl-tRNA synthetase